MGNLLRPIDGVDGHHVTYVAPPILFGNERVVFVRGQIGSVTMDIVGPNGPFPMISGDDIAIALFWLDKESHDPIKLVVNSSGGSISDGFIVIDAMRSVKAPVWVLVLESASFATTIATSGEIGHRYALPHATLHLHGASTGTSGKQSDVKSHVEYGDRLTNWILDILIERSKLTTKVGQIKSDMKRFMTKGRDLDDSNGVAASPLNEQDAAREAILRYVENDRFLTAQQAVDIGIVDHIATPELVQQFFNIG